jgi:hypothetical protein
MNKNAYRVLTLIYLAPIALLHFVNDTNAVGAAAQGTSLLFGLTIGLALFAALPWIGRSARTPAANSPPGRAVPHL